MSTKALSYIFVLAVIATDFMSAGVAKAQVVTDGLVSYWTFDKTHIDGKTVTDLLGNNDGAINGEPKAVDGKFGQALEFSEATDYQYITNAGSRSP